MSKQLFQPHDEDGIRQHCFHYSWQPQELAHDMGWRIYTEWCFNNPWDNHKHYAGEGFADWVRDETHYALVHRGLEWDDCAKRFGGLDEKVYEAMRNMVLAATVRCAVDFFKKGGTYREDDKNLRQSLAKYILF